MAVSLNTLCRGVRPERHEVEDRFLWAVDWCREQRTIYRCATLASLAWALDLPDSLPPLSALFRLEGARSVVRMALEIAPDDPAGDLIAEWFTAEIYRGGTEAVPAD